MEPWPLQRFLSGEVWLLQRCERQLKGNNFQVNPIFKVSTCTTCIYKAQQSQNLLNYGVQYCFLDLFVSEGSNNYEMSRRAVKPNLAPNHTCRFIQTKKRQKCTLFK